MVALDLNQSTGTRDQHAITGNGQRRDGTVRFEVKVGCQPRYRVQCCETISILSSNIAERANHIDGVSGRHDLEYTVVRVWVPCGRQSRGSVKRSEVVSWLEIRESDLCEETTDINRISVNGHSVDLPKGSGIEGCGVPGGRVQTGKLVTLLPANVRKLTGNNELSSCEHYAPHGIVRIGIPCRGSPGDRVECGDSIPRQPSNIGKASGNINCAVGRQQSVHRVIGGWIPV